MNHRWKWIEQDVRSLGDTLWAVDVWRCMVCGKVVRIRGDRDPAPGHCKARIEED